MRSQHLDGASHLKGAVDQRLVQIDHHADLPGVLGLGRGQQRLGLDLGDGPVLHQQGGVVVDRLGLRLVPAQAAEEAGEEAPAAGLLGGDGGRRTCGRRSQAGWD